MENKVNVRKKFRFEISFVVSGYDGKGEKDMFKEVLFLYEVGDEIRENEVVAYEGVVVNEEKASFDSVIGALERLIERVKKEKEKVEK